MRARFHEAFDRIRRFYRATKDVVSQSVVEPGAVIVATDRRSAIRCPRLMVQCMRPDSKWSLSLTLAYVPDGADRIALDIVHADTSYRTSQFFQWTTAEGWCSDHGKYLDAENHAATLRRALHESDLFTPASMELVPLTAVAGALR